MTNTDYDKAKDVQSLIKTIMTYIPATEYNDYESCWEAFNLFYSYLTREEFYKCHIIAVKELEIIKLQNGIEELKKEILG